MNRREASEVLGVGQDCVDEALIKAAFRRSVKLAHPDTGGGHRDAATNIARAEKARDTLLAGLKPKCKRCRGTGVLGDGGFGRKCPDCKGAGT